jgi:hypothetical protein
MSPEQAIAKANESGMCRIAHKIYLFKTTEASQHLELLKTNKPYILVFENQAWSDQHPVTNAKDARLVQACGVQNA